MREAYRSSGGCSKGSSRGPMIIKRPDPEERIGEVTGSKRGCCGRGFMQCIAEELMAMEKATKSHKGDRGRGSEKCHRDEMTVGVRERKIAEIKAQLQLLEERLQEQEKQKGKWIFPLKGKRVIWRQLQRRWRQILIALLEKGLRILVPEMKFENPTCRLVQRKLLKEAVRTKKSCSFNTDELYMFAGVEEDVPSCETVIAQEEILIDAKEVNQSVAGISEETVETVELGESLCMNASDEMVTTESWACENIEDCTEIFSKEMTGLWQELNVLEKRLEVQRISIQNIKSEMNEDKEVYFYEPEYRCILREDDAEDRLSDNLKNDWDQYTEMLAEGSKTLMPYDFYSNKCFVNAGIVAEHLTQFRREEFFCSRGQEGMDDRVAVRTETSIEARSQQSEDLLDKEIDLIRKIMLKVSQRKTSARKRSSRSSSRRKTAEDCESAASGVMQHKVWTPGEKQETKAAANGNLQHTEWDPGT